SVEWVNVPRAVIAIAKDDEDTSIRHVQVVAGNRVPEGEAGESFRVEAVHLADAIPEHLPPDWPDDAAPVVRATAFTGSSKDVEDLLSANRTEREGPVSKTRQAQMMILDSLEAAKGWVESDALDAQVAQAMGL